MRHIWKITALCGLVFFVAGLIFIVNSGIDAASSLPGTITDRGEFRLSPTESKSISMKVDRAKSLTFYLYVKNNSVDYSIIDPSGKIYDSGTVPSHGEFEKTIANPQDGVSIETIESAKMTIYGMIFAIVGLFIIIAGGVAGLINTIKRRKNKASL